MVKHLIAAAFAAFATQANAAFVSFTTFANGEVITEYDWFSVYDNCPDFVKRAEGEMELKFRFEDYDDGMVIFKGFYEGGLGVLLFCVEDEGA